MDSSPPPDATPPPSPPTSEPPPTDSTPPPTPPSKSPPPTSPPPSSPPPTDPPPSSPPPTDPPPSSPPPTDPPPSSPPSTDPPPSSPPPTTSSSPPPTDPPPSTTRTDPPPSTTPTASPPPTENQGSSSAPPSTPTTTPPAPKQDTKSPSSSSNVFSPPPPSSHSSSSSPPKALSPPSHVPTENAPGLSDYGLSPEKIKTYGGVAGGAGLLLIVMLLLLCCICKKRSKRKRAMSDHMQYYASTSHHRKGNEYFPSGQYANYPNSHQHGDHIVKVPPHSGGWSASPPPPPPQMMMSSIDEYGYNYSGSSQSPSIPQSHPSLGFNKSTFTYEELAAATGNFAQSNLLGQGGFGYVHKGVLPNGKEVAVKSLKAGSGQGEREFQAEVEIISRVHHRHLVSLVGYCIAGDQRLLVYEFLPNKTLEYHLHGKDHAPMEFPSRLKIALGSAKGLAYLHEDCHPKIIHRDIKTANILLDYNMDAQVADFGLAKLSSDTYTHVSTRIMGTFGYLAPEYAASGKLTEKSDVFSYGVMLLELITGKRPVDTTNAYMEDSLVDWARPNMARALEDNNFLGLVDANLEEYDVHEMTRMIACAAACIRHSARRRPKMSQIVRALEGDVSLDDLNEVHKSSQSSNFSNPSFEYEANSYNTDMKKFKKAPVLSGEYESSDFGETSEYGLNPSSSSSESSQDLGKKTNGSRRQFN